LVGTARPAGFGKNVALVVIPKVGRERLIVLCLGGQLSSASYKARRSDRL
jgi:hypothetical protein